MTKDEALEKKAENARQLGLDYYIPCCTDQTCQKCKAAIKPELVCVCGAVWEGQELIYTTPQRTWVGLTQDELNMIGDSMRTWNSWTITDVYFAIEAKLKEKNT